MTLSQLDYCQFLLSSPFNYTQTYFSNHMEGLSHDRVNRLLQQLDVQPEDLWQSVQETICTHTEGYLLYDDTVLDKRHSFKIEYVRSQWSGNEHRTIKGIGVVTCVYVNPETQQFWAIDYRLYSPDKDGKSKLDHVKEMFKAAVEEKKLPFRTVLMDSWYSEREFMLSIAAQGMVYYTPVKLNRLVAEHRGEHAYKNIESLDWTEKELVSGKRIRLNDFPKEHKVQLFRVSVLPNRTEYIVTNDLRENTTESIRETCSIRWKIEEFHREIKQLTGIERCQSRKGIIQKNHIGCAILAWSKLKNLAYKTGENVYALWNKQYDSLITYLFKNPVISLA